jgi:hypothetical protein
LSPTSLATLVLLGAITILHVFYKILNACLSLFILSGTNVFSLLVLNPGTNL